VKLLHPEIDVVPGRKPQKQPLPEGFVGRGTATLRLTNASARQNSYTVRVRCEQPYWQDAWVHVSALPAATDANAPPADKPDQPGPRGQSLTLFVRDDGTRDVVLAFDVPEKPECRAGVYKATVVVESRIVSSDPRQARKERIVEIPITVIVRPFFRWTVSYAPDERRVGILRRGVEFEMVVENQGNDWLYVGLKPPRPQQALVNTLAQSLAVPPLEPGSTSVRSVPVRVVSRLKAIRGPITPTPIPMAIERIDAPTVAPLAEEAAFGPGGSNVGGAVVANDTGDLATPTAPAKIVYSPPIPDTFTGFFEAALRNARGLVGLVIGGLLAWQVAAYSYEVYFKRITEVHSNRSQVKVGEPFRVSGKNLIGSQILLFDPQTKAPIGEPLDPKVEPRSVSENYVMVTIADKGLEGKHVVVGAKRLGKLTFLSPLLPVVKDPASLLVGQPPKPTAGPASGSVAATVPPGGTLTIGGVNFGETLGKVLIDGVASKVVGWTDDAIKVKLPAEKASGDTVSIAAFTADGRGVSISPATVIVKLAGEVAVTNPPVDPSATEPVIGPDGQPVSSPMVGGKGTTPPPISPIDPVRPSTAPGSLPAAYRLLVSDRRGDYVAAVDATRSARSTGDLAVRAFALAALGRTDEAKTSVRKALKVAGNRQKGEDVGLCLLALSRIVETSNPAAAKQGYAEADSQLEEVAPGFVFKDLVIARYKLASNSPFEARIILRDALKKGPGEKERAAIAALQKRVGE